MKYWLGTVSCCAKRLRHAPVDLQLQVDVKIGQADQVLDRELGIKLLGKYLCVRHPPRRNKTIVPALPRIASHISGAIWRRPSLRCASESFVQIVSQP